MDPDTQKYYDNYFDLFQSAGWKQFVEEITQNAVALNNVEQVKDNDDLRTRQGQLTILANILNFPATIENVYNEVTTTQEVDNA